MPAIVKVKILENKIVSLSVFFSVLPEHIRRKTQNRLKFFLNSIVELGKDIVHVLTGSLQKSIRRESYASPAGVMHMMGVRAGGFVVNPRTKRLVDYAAFHEARFPFIAPSWARRESLLHQVMREALYEAIREIKP